MADNFKFGKTSLEDLEATAKTKWEELWEKVKSNDGWTQFFDADEMKGFSKMYPYCPISAFKFEGLISASPKTGSDAIFNSDLAMIKRHDPGVLSLEKFGTPAPHINLFIQTNSLPWPIWNRQTVWVMYRRPAEADGSIWIYSWSVRDDKHAVDTNTFVEAKLYTACWGFVPDKASGKTKVVRLIHIDPAGNLPAWVVELNANNLNLVIKDLRNLK